MVNVPSEFCSGVTSIMLTGFPLLYYAMAKKFDGQTKCEYKSLILLSLMIKYLNLDGHFESGHVGGLIFN
jgi:hypothetical protein